MVESLAEPVLVQQGPTSHLVEARFGRQKYGYFPVEVLPQCILVKTFLFLTMQGTPEAELLRSKLGLRRSNIEKYALDSYETLVLSDLALDPLLSRVLTECGCGHLLKLVDVKNRIQWATSLGEQLKSTFSIREVGRGFMAGQKWNKWTKSDLPTDLTASSGPTTSN
jgi:hypothetical protein